ncbi:MAG: hypothetical protein QOK31_93, partial [Solirubrobacteraceae bacterium]|nr:hypothetical protein [Solirubrobacteraceae bacterium]
MAAGVSRMGRERACGVALGLATALSVSLSLWLTRGTTFFLDDVTFFVTSRGLDPRVLLAPGNGHLLAVPRLIYAATFAFFGADYFVLRFVEAAGIAVVAA